MGAELVGALRKRHTAPAALPSQHARSLLRSTGRCAIVVPDNVLFAGGAGETVRRHLLEQCDVHTLLRLPTGIFWLKDESLSESENLPEPDMLAQEIAEDLQAALEQFSAIAGDLAE